MSHRQSTRTHGSMAVQYSLMVVVVGLALVATVGLARVVLTSFSGATTCFGVAHCPSAAAATDRAVTATPVSTLDALGNPITLGCAEAPTTSADHGCGNEPQAAATPASGADHR